jgi:hypothetical protein
MSNPTDEQVIINALNLEANLRGSILGDDFYKIALADRDLMESVQVKRGKALGVKDVVDAFVERAPKLFTGPIPGGTPPRREDRPLSTPPTDRRELPAVTTATSRPQPRTRAEALRFREGDIAKMKVHRTLAELRKPKM